MNNHQWDIIKNRFDFDQIRDARICIMGGTGWFGRWLSGALSRADISHHITSRSAGNNYNINCTSYADKKPLYIAYSNNIPKLALSNFDYLVFLSHGIGQEDEAAIYLSDHPKCKFLYASSGAVVYQDISTKDKLRYVAEKTHGEFRFADYTIARCYSFIGAQQPSVSHNVVGQFIFDAIHNKEIHIYGDGQTIRSYMDMSELTAALLNCMAGRQGVQVIGSSTPITLAELARLVVANTGHTAKIIVENKLVETTPVYYPEHPDFDSTIPVELQLQWMIQEVTK
jgi:hypothetical protein